MLRMDSRLTEFRAVVSRVMQGPEPDGAQFDALRELLRRDPAGETGYQALCMLLEGALTRPDFPVRDTGTVVAALHGLAEGGLTPEALL